jgi:hypothetical protein
MCLLKLCDNLKLESFIIVDKLRGPFAKERQTCNELSIHLTNTILISKTLPSKLLPKTQNLKLEYKPLKKERKKEKKRKEKKRKEKKRKEKKRKEKKRKEKKRKKKIRGKKRRGRTSRLMPKVKKRDLSPMEFFAKRRTSAVLPT